MTQAELSPDATRSEALESSPEGAFLRDTETPVKPSVWQRVCHLSDRFADGVEYGWRFARDVWSLLRVMRFAVLSLSVYLLLISVPQGVDSLLTLLDRPVWQWALINYFAFQTWQWSRVMATYRYLPLDRRDIAEESLEQMGQTSRKHLEALETRYAGDTARAREAGVNLEQLRTAQAHFDAKVARIKRQNVDRQSTQAMGRLEFWMVWLPRLLGAAVYLAASVSLWRAASRYGGLNGPRFSSGALRASTCRPHVWQRP